MLCGPAARLEVANVALPVPSSEPLPSVFAPSLNATVPDGVAPAPATVAVSVTSWPFADGFAVDVSVVVDGVCAATISTAARFHLSAVGDVAFSCTLAPELAVAAAVPCTQ